MENSQEIKSKIIISLLTEIIALIEAELEKNPFIGLEKSLQIVAQRNYNQYPSVKNKIGDVIRMIYGQRFEKANEIIKKLDEIYLLLTESS